MNFRNLENTSIDLSDKINVFYGKNAQGKTSLLEAIYYSSTGISFKTKKTSEMIKYNFDEFISSISYQDYICLLYTSLANAASTPACPAPTTITS